MAEGQGSEDGRQSAAGWGCGPCPTGCAHSAVDG
jgi:hypothetical protein